MGGSFLQDNIKKGTAEAVYCRGVNTFGVEHGPVDKGKIRPVNQGVPVDHEYSFHFTHSANDVGVSYNLTLCSRLGGVITGSRMPEIYNVNCSQVG